MWDAKRAALTTYFVTPVDARPGTRWMPWPIRLRGTLELDELKLKASEDAIRAAFRLRPASALSAWRCTSPASTTSRAWRKLFSVMAKFDKTLLAYRVMRITGVEPGFPRIYLEDIARTLKARIPNIAIGLNWTEPDVASVLRLQPAAIGFTLPPGALTLACAAGRAVRARACRDRPGAAARHAGLCRGDFAPDQAQRFAMDGVQLLASPRIWPTGPPARRRNGRSSKLSEAVRCEGAFDPVAATAGHKFAHLPSRLPLGWRGQAGGGVGMQHKLAQPQPRRWRLPCAGRMLRHSQAQAVHPAGRSAAARAVRQRR